MKNGVGDNSGRRSGGSGKYFWGRRFCTDDKGDAGLILDRRCVFGVT